MYDLELIFVTTKGRKKKIYISNVKRSISDKYILNVMEEICKITDFNVTYPEITEPDTFRFIKKAVVRSFNFN